MYQSLYRKYRPSTFDEVVGQEVPVKILKNAIKNNRIAHAYLFAGIRGTGKTSIAKIFAKTINCVEPKNMLPCGECVVCTQKNNTDIVEIDAASNNGVDEIRELRDKIALVPSISKYKVYIIDEVHMLSTSAFNALLKTLEEPPSHAIFILATTEVHKIPLTILSRCQRLDFKSITLENIVKRLSYICEQENITISPDAVHEIARLANGGMRDAISLLEQAWAYSENITVDDVHKMNGTVGKDDIKFLFQNIIDNNIQSCFELINKFEEQGADFTKIVDEILYFARNLILNIITGNKVEDNFYDQTDYEPLKNKVSVQRLIDFIKKANISASEIRIVSNKKIVFEMLIINFLDKTNEIKEVEVKPEVKEILVSKTEKPILAKPTTNFIEKIEKEFNDSKSIKVIEEAVQSIETEAEPKVKKIENAADKKEMNEALNKLKTIRIDNTLAEFDKRTLVALQKRMETMHEYIIDLQYGEVASMILDGQLKAASKEYMLFVYEENLQSLKFNNKLSDIESLIKIALNTEYKVISINNDEWEIIKTEFNSKKKQYLKTEETEEIKKIIADLENLTQDFLDENFFDIISYE